MFNLLPNNLNKYVKTWIVTSIVTHPFCLTGTRSVLHLVSHSIVSFMGAYLSMSTWLQTKRNINMLHYSGRISRNLERENEQGKRTRVEARKIVISINYICRFQNHQHKIWRKSGLERREPLTLSLQLKINAAIISSQLFRFTLDSSSNIHRPLACSFVSCAFSRARLILIQLEIWLPYLWLLYFHLPHWSTQLHIFNGFSYFPYLWIMLINKSKFTQKSKLFTWKLWSDFPFNFSLSNFYRTPSTISNGNWFEYVNWQPSLRNYWQNFDTLGAFIRIISNSFETGMLE